MKVYVLKRVLVADGFVKINETRVFADEKKAKETFKAKESELMAIIKPTYQMAA